MSLQLRLLSVAQADVDHIYSWNRDRSPLGAVRWYAAFLRKCGEVVVQPHRFPIKEESDSVRDEIREFTFRTRRGRRYRALFAVVGDEVRVLRVRGPGQPPIELEEIPS